MDISDVKACMFQEWYEQFKDITPKSIIIPLTEDFRAYLLSDGLVLPASAGEAPRLIVSDTRGAQREDDDDDDDDGWDNDNDDGLQAPDFGELEAAMKTSIASLGGAVFPKLNWSSPQDAWWVNFDHSMRCTCPSEVFLLLKSSDFITRDLTQPFIHCDDYKGDNSTLQYHLVLRRWVDIQPGMEFRCFVRNQCFIAVSQRHYNKYYEFIPAMKEEIVSQLTQFFVVHISPKFPLDNYVFDVYRDRHKRWRLLDLNPFGVITDSPLFPWSELNAWMDTSTKPSLRYIESQGIIRPSPYSHNALPQDIVDLCTGQDPHKVVDFLKLQSKISTQNQCDSSDESNDGETGPL